MWQKIKPRKVSSLISRVLSKETDAGIIYSKNGGKNVLTVKLDSALSWSSLMDDIDLPILNFDSQKVMERGAVVLKFFISWDCSSIRYASKEHDVSGFSFDKAEGKRDRKKVTEQEEEGARLIGGERHVGSGAISDLKSDASSDFWQQEAKQTAAKSFRLTLDVLNKITREAMIQAKQPMVFLRFTDVTEGMVVDSDWVIMPKGAFELMSKLAGFTS